MKEWGKSDMLLTQATHEGTPLFESVVDDSVVDSILIGIIAYGYPVALVAAIAFVVVAFVHDPFAVRAWAPSTNLADNTVEGGGDYVI